ncbi:plasmid stabilization protein [Actinocrinis sp.]|uniref:plasmid stabilization protein n=1 Tax=Actinocrinis sp. TaxID=1920516 RepID=UPI002BC5AA6B|nr:plasmid stabilization protein [Actinocrinis sp.]HXR71224.1 plasmid stabilization protein [Actinocrinis sp.]
MPRGSSPKRERQYEHIESSARERGESPKRAKEIAARTVNKERARSGEAKSSSRSSTRGPSPSSRGGQRSGGNSRGPSGSANSGQTYRELYAEAKRRDIKGRSTMDKAQLERALSSSGSRRT